MLVDRGIRGLDGGTSGSDLRTCVAAEIRYVFHAGFDAGDALVIQCAPFPAVRNCIGVGPHLVRPKVLEVLALAVEHAHVRSEEFVCRAGQEVAVERRDVDEPVRSVVDGIDVAKGAGRVSQAYDFLDGIDGADRIRRVANGDKLCFFVDLRRQVGHVERAVGVVDFCPANSYAPIFCHGQPRRDVRVVIEASHEDFVPAIEVAADGARDGEGQRRHVGTEGDFVGAAVQEVGHGAASPRDHCVGVSAGRVSSASIGVVVAQVGGDGVDHALRDLRSARAVEERGGVAVHGLRERRKLRADVGEVEGSGQGFDQRAHRSLFNHVEDLAAPRFPGRT